MPPETGFSFVNLAILLVVALVVVPGYLRLRRVVSARRRERWAQEEADYRAAVERRDVSREAATDEATDDWPGAAHGV